MFKKLAQKDTAEIVRLYQKGISAEKIGIKYGVCKKTILNALRNEDVPRRKGGWRRKIIAYDETFFDKVDSSIKAYWLGFVAADGCIANEPRQSFLQFNLSSKDECHLKSFAEDIGFDGTIMHFNQGDFPLARLRIYSKHLVESLMAHGCAPRKSLSLQFPSSLPEKYLPAWILGYFDGDGSINVWQSNKPGRNALEAMVQIIGTYNVLKGICTVLDAGINGFSTTIRPYGAVYKITYGGARQVVKTLEFLYSSSDRYLKRKHERYLQIVRYLREVD